MNFCGPHLDILVQSRRNQRAAARFFCHLLKGQGGEPRWLITDKLPSYTAAHRTIMPTVNHRLLRARAFQVWQEAVCA